MKWYWQYDTDFLPFNVDVKVISDGFKVRNSLLIGVKIALKLSNDLLHISALLTLNVQLLV